MNRKTAVSYTHLDVYKRQPVLNANEVKVNFRVSPHSAVAELIKGEEGKYLIAADYQDVYKRQPHWSIHPAEHH